ncbi:MAG: hypothetical protein V9F00_05040 [Nocardioides sp.]
MTFPRVQRLSANGAVLGPGADRAVLPVAVRLPQGGSLLVDALSPSVPLEVFLSRAQIADPEVRSWAEQLRRAVVAEGALPAVPPAWVRRCVVGAVDRWFDDVLDAELMNADRLSADSALGLDRESRDAAVLDRLRSLASELLAEERPPPVAVVDELRWVATTLGLRLPALPTAQLRATSTSSGGGSIPERSSGAHGDHGLHVVEHPLDPRLIPSRTLVGPLRVAFAQGSALLTCDLSAGISVDSPVLSRLIVRALDAETGAVLAVGGLQPNAVARTVTGELTFPESGPRPLVQVLDSLAAALAIDPSPGAVERVRGAQVRFTRERLEVTAAELTVAHSAQGHGRPTLAELDTLRRRRLRDLDSAGVDDELRHLEEMVQAWAVELGIPELHVLVPTRQEEATRGVGSASPAMGNTYRVTLDDALFERLSGRRRLRRQRPAALLLTLEAGGTGILARLVVAGGFRKEVRTLQVSVPTPAGEIVVPLAFEAVDGVAEGRAELAAPVLTLVRGASKPVLQVNHRD